jgi:hypothetical protein
MNYDAMIEQLRAWADELETAVKPLTTAAGSLRIARTIAGMREVAADLERDQVPEPERSTR